VIVCLQRNRRDVSPSSDVADELNRNLALGPHTLQGKSLCACKGWAENEVGLCDASRALRQKAAVLDPHRGAPSQKSSIIHALLLYEETVKAMLVPSGDASGAPTSALVVHSCETWPSDEM